MFKQAKLFFMLCETPLHAGSGDDLGVVDQPIQRERHTGFPKVESSSLKGALREVFEKMTEISLNGKEQDKEKFKKAIELTFGPESGDKHAGALGFTDSRLLLFPVKSVKGVFAWITCPQVLERFKNDLSLCGIEKKFKIPLKMTAPENCSLFIKKGKIVLEEYTFALGKDDKDCTDLAKWLSVNVLPSEDSYSYWRDKMKQDVIVLADDDFRDFVNMSTEVITRIKIDNKTGIVQSGALFTEEYLPVESVMYSLVLTSPVFNQDKSIFAADNTKGNMSKGEKEAQEAENIMKYFTENISKKSLFQLGGNASIGKGFMRIKVQNTCGRSKKVEV